MENSVQFRSKHFQTNALFEWQDIQIHEQFCDVTLACEYDQLSAHKAVLSSFSPVLAKILKDHPHQDALIFLPGVNFSDLASVIDFMYRGEVKILQKNFSDFQNLLKELKITEDFKIEQNTVELLKTKMEEKEIIVMEDIEVDPFIKDDQEINVKSIECFSMNDVSLLDKNLYKSNGGILKSDLEIIDTQKYNSNMNSKSNSTRHIQRTNIEEYTNKKRKREGGYKCNTCDFEWAFQKDLSSHMKLIHNMKNFSCEICGLQTNHLAAIIRHKASVHSDDKPYLCNDCGKGFKKDESLKRHVQSIHGNDKFPCSTCGKDFKCLDYLKFHEKSHNYASLLHCIICEKGFVTNARLKQHTNTHSGEKPYLCTHLNCNRRFSSSSSLCHHKKSCSYNQSVSQSFNDEPELRSSR